MTKCELSPKQTRFAELYASGSSGADAYRQSYDAAKSNQATQRKRAAELLKHPGVKAYIATLREKAREGVAVDFAYLVTALRENIEISLVRQAIKIKQAQRDKQSGALSVRELEISARDAGAVSRSADVLARMLGYYEKDNAQKGEALSEATEHSSRDLARAVLDILRQAKIGNGTPAPNDEHQQGEPEEEADPPVPLEPVSPAPASVGPTRSTPVSRRPTDRLGPGDVETLPSGAHIAYASELKKWAVFDGAGHLHGYKRDLGEARSLAARIKPVA
jgi:hypothetical protein